MKNTILYSVGFMILGLISCNSEKTETLNDDRTEQLAQDSIQKEEIKTIALSFHKWYLAATDERSNLSASADVVKGADGKCQFDFYDYFDVLRELGTISEKFLISEKARVSDCENYLKTIDYDEYVSSDAYFHQDNCPQFYYLYWTQSQESFSGVEIEELTKKGDSWQAELVFYNDLEKKEYFRHYQPIVTISKEDKSWKIVSIK